jgi:hypothetical protein
MKFGMSNPRIYWHDKKPVPSVSTVVKIFNNGIPFNWPAKRAMDFIKSDMVDPEFSLEDALVEAVHDAEKYVEECSVLGTLVHATIADFFLTGNKDPGWFIDEAGNVDLIIDRYILNKMLNNVWKWMDKYHVVPILVEKALSCRMYAGTLDLFCEIDSEAFETKRWCKARGVEFPQPHRRVRALIDWKITASYYDDMPVKLSAYKHLLDEKKYDPEAMIIVRFSRDTGSLNVKDYTGEYTDSFITFDLACQLFHHNFKKYLDETEQEATRQRTAKIERKVSNG